MDENTRRQITWVIVAGAVLALIVFAAGRRGELNRLRGALTYGNPAQRVAAVAQLIDMDKLSDGLAHQPRWVQDEAVDAACYLGTEKAFFQLMTCWNVVDAPVQPRIARAVSRYGALAIPALVQALTDKDASIRAGAPGVLTTIGQPVIPYLLPLMSAYDDYVRTGVATVFGGIGQPVAGQMVAIIERSAPGPSETPEEYLREKACATTSLVNMKANALNAIVGQLLKSASPEVRGEGASMLGTIGAALTTPAAVQVVPPLVALIDQDGSWAVRRKAAASLGLLGQVALQNGAVAPLIARLQDSRPEVRAAAATALGKIKAVSAAPVLAADLIAGNSGASREISAALVQLGAPGIAPLEPGLSSSNAEVRLMTTQTIAGIGGDTAVAPLARAVQDPTSAAVRQAAAEALRNLPPNALVASASIAVPALATALRDNDWRVYYAARDALAKMGSSAVPSLVQALGSTNARVAHMAEMALTSIGAAAVPGLIQAIGSSNSTVTNWASIALGEIAEPSVAPLTKIITNEAASASTRAAAADALGRTGMNSALQPLTVGTQAKDPQVRAASLKGIAELGDPDGTSALVAGLSDPNLEVRNTATSLLKNWRMGDVQDELKKLLTNKDVDTQQRAAIALVYENSTVANALLREISGSTAAEADMARQTAPILTAMVNNLSLAPNLRRDAVVALGYVGNDQSVTELEKLLEPGDPLAVAGGNAIAMIGTRLEASKKRSAASQAKLGEAAQGLIKLLLQPPSEDVRLAAAAALAKMQNIPVNALTQELAQHNDELTAWSAAVLAAIGKPAVEKLMQLRGNTKDLREKTWCAATLQVIGDAMAMQIIRHVPDDEKPQPGQVQAIETNLALIRKTQGQ